MLDDGLSWSWSDTACSDITCNEWRQVERLIDSEICYTTLPILPNREYTSFNFFMAFIDILKRLLSFQITLIIAFGKYSFFQTVEQWSNNEIINCVLMFLFSKEEVITTSKHVQGYLGSYSWSNQLTLMIFCGQIIKVSAKWPLLPN